MISHGFVSGAMFLCVGVMYDRMHSRQIADYGGVVNKMPRVRGIFHAVRHGQLGTARHQRFCRRIHGHPGRDQSEFLVCVLRGDHPDPGAAYTLWMYKRVVFGPIVHPGVEALDDVNIREIFVLAVLALAVLWMGLYPLPLMEVMHTTVDDLLAHVARSKL